MKKTVVMLLLAAFSVFMACSDDPAAKLDEKTAALIALSVVGVVNNSEQSARQYAWPPMVIGVSLNGTSREGIGSTDYPINWANESGSITAFGTLTLFVDNTFSYTMHLVITDITTNNGTGITGTTDINCTNGISSVLTSTYTSNYTGDFTVVYSGTEYNLSWDVNYTATETGCTIGGSLSIDGNDFTWNYASPSAAILIAAE